MRERYTTWKTTEWAVPPIGPSEWHNLLLTFPTTSTTSSLRPYAPDLIHLGCKPLCLAFCTQPSKWALWKRGNVKVRWPDLDRWGIFLELHQAEACRNLPWVDGWRPDFSRAPPPQLPPPLTPPHSQSHCFQRSSDIWVSNLAHSCSRTQGFNWAALLWWFQQPLYSSPFLHSWSNKVCPLGLIPPISYVHLWTKKP